KLMEGLPEELGACEATVHPCGIPAALHDRGNARVLLNFQSGIVAAAVRAHGREEAWRHDRASARETVKDVTILMLVEQYVNLGLDAIDGIDQATQLRNQGLKDRYRCGDHRGVLGERTIRRPTVSRRNSVSFCSARVSGLSGVQTFTLSR